MGIENLAHLSRAQNNGFVNEEFTRIAEILNDIDKDLRLAYIEPTDMTEEEKKIGTPYVILVCPPFQQPYVYKHLKRSDLNQSLITNILMDKRNSSNLVDIIEAHQLAEDLIKAKEDEDKNAEILDKLHFRLKRGF